MSRPFLAVVCALSGSGFAVALVNADREARSVEQPLAFNHARHAEFEIECADCHEGVEQSAFAMIPPVSLCMGCHEDEDPATPEMKRLMDAAAGKAEIPWVRLYRLPAHVIFSHERHVVFGEVSCRTCHGNHGTSERPPPRPEPMVLTMAGCMECHETRHALNDCIACHR